MGSDLRRPSAVVTTLWALVAGLIVMYLVLFALSAAGRLARPADEFTYGESWLLDGARRVARGEGLYPPADQIPLMHVAYTPLYYLVVGALQRVVGDTGYGVGRVVSLLAALVGAAALACSVQRLTWRWTTGLLAAGFFLTQNLTVLLWAPLHRADPLALGLTLLGLALATSGRVTLAAIVFLSAVLTKQTFLVAPLAVAVTLWPCKAKLLRFGSIVVGGGIVALGVAQWLTHGWFVWHTLTANTNEPDLITFSALMGSFVQYNGLPVLAALTSLSLPAAPGERLWRVYFLGCLATLPGLAKLGASSNYWLELTAATAVLLALASCRMAVRPTTRLLAPCIVAGSLLIALPGYQAGAVQAAATLVDLTQPASATHYLSLVGDDDTRQALRVDTRLVDQLAREPGDVLADNSGLAVAAGKPIAFEFQIFQLLRAEQHWSEQPILDAVTARRFSLLALMHPLDGPLEGTRWTPALRAAMQAAYAPAGQQAGFWLYRPRP